MYRDDVRKFIKGDTGTLGVWVGVGGGVRFAVPANIFGRYLDQYVSDMCVDDIRPNITVLSMWTGSN